MEKIKNVKRGLIIGIIACTLMLVSFLGSYAYFLLSVNNSNNQDISVNTSNIELIFEDGNNGIIETLDFNTKVEKIFIIENTGSTDTKAKISWIDLLNTYGKGSLTYNLSYANTVDGNYQSLILNRDVPTSSIEVQRKLSDELLIPSNTKYYYKLTITLNYLESTDQTADLNAFFSTHFKLDETGFGYTLNFDSNGGISPIDSKEYDTNTPLGELPVPLKDGHEFLGWFTKISGGEEVTSETQLTKDLTIYAHWTKKSIATQLLAKANDESITDYNQGIKEEMFVFNQGASAQTEALTDYRYIGNIPNNYIRFNDEIWRIIGVFTVEDESGEKEERVKIIREESIGNIPWDTAKSNNWPTSSLNILLNDGDYYNKDGSFENIGLTEQAKLQIAPTKFYLGGSSSYRGLNGSTYYNFERGTASNNSNSINSISKVGIMYPSDYVHTFALQVNPSCYGNAYTCAPGNPTTSWLHSSLNEWTITQRTNAPQQVFNITAGGAVVNSTGSASGTSGSRLVRPVVYLSSENEIIGGDGSSPKNAYILKDLTK